MGKDQEVLKEGSPNKAKLKMTFAVLCLAALFIVELYLMMNDSKNYLLLGIAGLAILCFVYMVTDLCFKIRGEKDILAEKRYENIYKAEKVSYIHMKQSVMDLEKLLEQIKSNSEIPTDELIEAQKAIGKVTIQRNKDNAAAVMDSNEQLRKTVASLEESLNRMTERLETPQQSLEPSVSGQEFLETTEQSRALVKEEISALADQMEMQIRQISDAVAQISAAAPSAPESIDRETIKTILDELKSEDRLPEPALPQTEAEKQKTAEPKVSEAFEIPEPVAPAAAETPVLQEAEMLEEPEFAGEEILDEQNAEITEPAAASIEPEPKAAELLKEAEELAWQGVKELILVAQETTLYGMDLYGRKCLPELLTRLCRIKELEWIRILYCYPEEITEELISVMKREEKICHYLDIPVQSGSDTVLKRMGRKTDSGQIKNMVRRLREEIPDICLRTTLIAGFPGETEAEHEQTLDFVDEMEFDRLGVFTYSEEEDTPAAKMPNQIPEEEKERRRDEIMELQQEIAFENAEAMVGRRVKAMIEGKVADENAYVARTYKDAPGVDGFLFINTQRELMSGDFADVKITGSNEYDLIGEMEEER